MAIVVEEEKKQKTSVLSVLIWLVIVGVAGSAFYFIFRTPQATNQVVPDNFKTTQSLSQTRIQPDTMTQDPIFNSLQRYAPDLSIGDVGKSNPFQPPNMPVFASSTQQATTSPVKIVIMSKSNAKK